LSKGIKIVKCGKERSRNNYYYNKDKINAQRRKLYKKPENKQKKKIYQQREDVKLHRKIIQQKYSKLPYVKELQVVYRKKYHDKDRSKSRDYQKRYREINNESIRIKGIDYNLKNPEITRRIGRNRRIRKLNAQGNHSIDDWLGLKILLGNYCLGCWKNNIELHQDHIIPLSKGGSDWIDNIQPLCFKCNSSKHAKYDVPKLMVLQ